MSYQNVSFFIFCFAITCSFINVHSMQSPLTGNLSARSVYDYWDIPNVEFAYKDVKNLLASSIISDGGWWYPERTLQHGCYVGSVCFDSKNEQLLTGDENGILRRWDLKSFDDVTTQEEGAKKLVGQMQLFGASQRGGSAFTQVSLGELNNIVVHDSLSKPVCVFDEAVRIGNFDENKNVHINTKNNYECKKAFVLPKGKEVIILHNQTTSYPRNKLYRMKKLLIWYDLNAKKVKDSFYTKHVNLPFAGCTGDMHPSGHCFFIGEDKHITGISLKDGQFIEHHIQWTNDGIVTALKFSPSGKHLISGRNNGFVDVHEINENLEIKNVSKMFELEPGIVNDIQFHPNGSQFFVATRDSIFLCSVIGKRMCELKGEGMVKQLAIHPSGTMLVKVGPNVNGGAAVVWSKVTQPSLDQVLMRLILKKHVVSCALLCIDTITANLTKDTLVDWMADRFNLDKQKLDTIWHSMPIHLQESIVKTMINRGKYSQAIEQKYHGRERVICDVPS